MRLKRALIALPIAAALALAGCSSNSSEDAGSDQSSSAPSADASASADSSAAPDGSAPDASAPKADVKDIPAVVAVVNGEKIDKDLFVTTYQGQYQQAVAAQQQQGGAAVDQDELKKKVLDSLVGNRLLVQAAKDSGIKASKKDISDTLDQIAKQSNMKSGDEVVAALKKKGVSEKQIQQDAASQYAVTTYIEKEGNLKEPTDKELQAQYDDIVKQMKASGQADESSIPAFKDVRDQLAQQARNQQENDVVQKLLKKLRKNADIKTNL